MKPFYFAVCLACLNFYSKRSPPCKFNFSAISVCLLNWRWHKNLFQGKYSPMRIFQFCIDILTLFSMIALIYSSIVLSRYVFAFLPIAGGMALARRLHILGSYWGFLLMNIHLGLHWNMVIGVVQKRMRIKKSLKNHQGYALFCCFSLAQQFPCME